MIDEAAACSSPPDTIRRTKRAVAKALRSLRPLEAADLALLVLASGLYRFKKIYAGENWQASVRSPLTEPGVDVKVGDYLLAVNGRPLRAPQTPYELLENTAGENVTLTVNSLVSPTSSVRGRSGSVEAMVELPPNGDSRK